MTLIAIGWYNHHERVIIMKIGYCGKANDLLNFSGEIMDYIEVSLTDLRKASTEQIREFKEKSNTAGIPIETANCFFPGDMRLCGENCNEEIIKEYCKDVLLKGAELGIKLAVVGSGKAREISADASYDDCFKQFGENLCIIADIAQDNGIEIVLEPLNSADTNVINNITDGAKLVRKLNHPNLFLLADLFHMIEDNDPYQGIVDNKDILKHFHIAKGVTRRFPADGDGFDYSPFKENILKAGYDGRISVEGTHDSDYTAELTNSVKYLKNFFGK